MTAAMIAGGPMVEWPSCGLGHREALRVFTKCRELLRAGVRGALPSVRFADGASRRGAGAAGIARAIAHGHAHRSLWRSRDVHDAAAPVSRSGVDGVLHLERPRPLPRIAIELRGDEIYATGVEMRTS
jgi:hypothetical protein